MSTLELKKNLIQRIVEINDVSFLKAIKTILDIRSNEEVISLTPKLRKEILYSKKEIEKGLFFNEEDIEKEIDIWLKVK